MRAVALSLGGAGLALLATCLGAFLAEAPSLIDLPVLHYLAGRELALTLRVDLSAGLLLGAAGVLGLAAALRLPSSADEDRASRYLPALSLLGAALLLTADHPVLQWLGLEIFALSLLRGGGSGGARAFLALQLCAALLLLSHALSAVAAGDFSFEQWRDAGALREQRAGMVLSLVAALGLAGVPPFHGWRIAAPAIGRGFALSAGLAPLLGFSIALRAGVEHSLLGEGLGGALALLGFAGAAHAGLQAALSSELRRASAYLAVGAVALPFGALGLSGYLAEGVLPVAPLALAAALVGAVGAALGAGVLQTVAEDLARGAGADLAGFGGVWVRRPWVGWALVAALLAIVGAPSSPLGASLWFTAQAIVGLVTGGVGRTLAPVAALGLGLGIALLWIAGARLFASVLLGRPRSAATPEELRGLPLASLVVPLVAGAALAFGLGPFSEQLAFTVSPLAGQMNISISAIAVESEAARFSPLVLWLGVGVLAAFLFDWVVGLSSPVVALLWLLSFLRPLRPLAGKLLARRAGRGATHYARPAVARALLSPSGLAQPLRAVARDWVGAEASLSAEQGAPLAPRPAEYSWSAHDRLEAALESVGQRAQARPSAPGWMWPRGGRAYLLGAVAVLLLFLVAWR